MTDDQVARLLRLNARAKARAARRIRLYENACRCIDAIIDGARDG